VADLSEDSARRASSETGSGDLTIPRAMYLPSAMTRPPVTTSNHILNAIRGDARASVLPQLENITLAPRQILYEQGESIAHVYFPGSAVVSLMTVVEEGSSIEISAVGNEGVIGPGLMSTEDSAITRAVTQLPGDALRMKLAAFQEAVQQYDSLQDLVSHSTQVLLVKIARAAGCNGLHPVEQRCARWLLSLHDRLGADEFPLTQEFLAEMLGVSRPRINVVAGVMQKTGLIAYARGRVKVLSREKLEAASCGCYASIKQEVERLLAPARRSNA
jgi:CRP-like cAMP-binding protein